jgi:hypothetical protein
MININLQNVEELIFQNKELWRKMPDLVYLRDQWRMSKMTPMLRALGKRSFLDFLNKVSKKHEDIISEHFGQPVTIDKLDRHIIKNITYSIDDAEDCLFWEETYPYFSTYRKENRIYISFWR